MANVNYKSCIQCGDMRPWYQQECSQCDETDYDIINREGASLVQNAIGDSVTEFLLIEGESPRINFSERRIASLIIPSKLQDLIAQVTINILNNPIADYIRPDEKPHFILKSQDSIQRKKDDEVSQLTLSDNFRSSRIIISNERVLFLIPQESGDVVRSCNHSTVTEAYYEEGNIWTNFIIRTDEVSYTVSKCKPSEEVAPAVAYIRAQAQLSEQADTDWSEDEYQSRKGSTRDEKVKEVFEQVDFKRVVGCGATGAKFGARAGPKGAAIGFVVGAGFGIWSSATATDASKAESPDPERVAKDVKEWQQSGAQTGDERVEWLAAATGAAVSFSSQNSDYETLQILETTDPESVVTALEYGARTVDNVPVNLASQDSRLDTLPEIENLRQPASETAMITAELFEAGLFTELTRYDTQLD